MKLYVRCLKFVGDQFLSYLKTKTKYQLLLMLSSPFTLSSGLFFSFFLKNLKEWLNKTTAHVWGQIQNRIIKDQSIQVFLTFHVPKQHGCVKVLEWEWASRQSSEGKDMWEEHWQLGRESFKGLLRKNVFRKNIFHL